MQLVLIDQSEAHFTAYEPSEGEYYDGHPYYYGTTEEVTIRPGCSDERDFTVTDFWRWKAGGSFPKSAATVARITDSTRRLVLEILTKMSKTNGSSTLALFLANIPPSEYHFNFTLKSTSDFNILKELRDRFQDKVRISASITCSNNVQECDAYGVVPGCGIASPGSVVITADHTCNLGSLYLRNLAALKYLSVHVQVTAHIPYDTFIPEVKTISVVGKIQKILDRGLFSDVIITAENGVQIKAHRSFLVAFSSVFEKMFGTSFEEAKTGKVDMTDLSEEGVRAFLRYIYFNDTVAVKPYGDICLAVELLYAAHKYDVQALEASMIQHLLVERKDRDFGTQEAFIIYMFVRTIESAIALKKRVISILHRNFDELKALPEYKELSEKNPRDAKELLDEIAKVTFKK